MRKIASILLLTMLLFNWFGYRLVSSYLQQLASRKMDVRLKKQDYDPADLIEVRVPVNLPYFNDQTSFEPYEGETTVNGVHYRYVKRKLEKGQLVLLCLKDIERTRLENARDEFFRLVNDLREAGNSHKSNPANTSNITRIFMWDFYEKPESWSMASLEIIRPPHPPLNASHYLNWYGDTPVQPPELYRLST